jgi:putative membrane protein
MNQGIKLVIRWVVSALALFAAAMVVPGIHVERNSWTLFAVMAIILGLVNAIVRPLLKLLSCPLVILTLGLFLLVINGLTLWLASYIAVNWFHVGFYVRGFWAAFWGALVVSIVSMAFHVMIKEERKAQ